MYSWSTFAYLGHLYVCADCNWIGLRFSTSLRSSLSSLFLLFNSFHSRINHRGRYIDSLVSHETISVCSWFFYSVRCFHGYHGHICQCASHTDSDLIKTKYENVVQCLLLLALNNLHQNKAICWHFSSAENVRLPHIFSDNINLDMAKWKTIWTFSSYLIRTSSFNGWLIRVVIIHVSFTSRHNDKWPKWNAQCFSCLFFTPDTFLKFRFIFWAPTKKNQAKLTLMPFTGIHIPAKHFYFDFVSFTFGHGTDSTTEIYLMSLFAVHGLNWSAATNRKTKRMTEGEPKYRWGKNDKNNKPKSHLHFWQPYNENCFMQIVVSFPSGNSICDGRALLRGSMVGFAFFYWCICVFVCFVSFHIWEANAFVWRFALCVLACVCY